MIDEEKKEDRRNKVNEYIEQMVTKYIKLSKIVIQAKTKTGYRSIKNIRIVAIRKESSFYMFPCYFFEMQIGISSNIWFVVKMP